MPDKGKIVVVSQYYPPDRNTTAAILSKIAEHLAKETPVLVLSGTAGSASLGRAPQLSVVEVKNWVPGKAALVRRAAAEIWLTARMFLVLLVNSSVEMWPSPLRRPLCCPMGSLRRRN